MNSTGNNPRNKQTNKFHPPTLLLIYLNIIIKLEKIKEKGLFPVPFKLFISLNVIISNL